MRERVIKIKEVWPEVSKKAKEQLYSPSKVWQMLKKAGAPYHPEMIKIDWDRFVETHYKAQNIRPRYTVLDVIADLGLTDQIVQKLFSEDGFWGRHRHPDAD